MEQKRVSFKVAKAIKEAGYWNPNTTITSQYNNPCYNQNGKLYEYGCICDLDNIVPAPTYLDVWLWLWREKCIRIEMCTSMINEDLCAIYLMGKEFDQDFVSPEEGIIAAIDHLVDHNLIK